jgi:hypothetical protein
MDAPDYVLVGERGDELLIDAAAGELDSPVPAARGSS